MSIPRARSRSRSKMQHEGIQAFPPLPPIHSQERRKVCFVTSSNTKLLPKKTTERMPTSTSIAQFWRRNNSIEDQMMEEGLESLIEEKPSTSTASISAVHMPNHSASDADDHFSMEAETAAPLPLPLTNANDSAQILLSDRYKKLAKEIEELPDQLDKIQEIQHNVETFINGFVALKAARKLK